MSHTSRRRRPAAALLGLLLLALLPVLYAVQAEAEDPSADGTDNTTVGIRTSGKTDADDRGVYAFEVPPGGYRIDYVAISNYSFHAVTVRVLSDDATSAPGAPFTAVGADHPSGVGAWVSLASHRLRLPPQSERIVPFQVSVPHNATPGDHAGAVIVSLLAHEPKPSGGEIVVDHRVGLRIYLRVPGALDPRLEITSLTTHFTGSSRWLGVGRMSTDYTVRNTGNVTLSGAQALAMTRAFGPSRIDVPIGDLAAILPGGSTDIHVDGPRMFAAGPVKTLVQVTPLSDTEGLTLSAVTAAVTTWVLPWAILLCFLGLLVLIALLLAWRRWRRRRRRAREAALIAAALADSKNHEGVAS